MAEEGEVVENSTPTPQPVAESAPAEVPTEPTSATSELAETPAPVSKSESPVPEEAATPSKTEPAHSQQDSKRRESAGERMRKVVKARKRERLEKIMDFVEQKRVVRNRDVKLLLQVSDVTASRYLKELVNKGQLKQLGRGRGAWYELI